jgi:glycogen synthase
VRVLVITSLYPPHHAGGYELACRDVVERWRRAGHTVDVLTSDVVLPGRPASRDEASVHRTLRLYDPPTGVEPPRRRALPAIEVANHLALARAWRAARPEVVSVWHHGGLGLSLLRQVALRRRPVVTVVADYWPAYAPRADPVVSKIARVLPDMVRLGAVVFCSAALRAAIDAQTSWDTSGARVVWLGVDTETFPVAAADNRPWRGRMLFVGRVSVEKGVETAVRAVGELGSDATLDVIGPGEGGELERLRALAESMGVADRVHFGESERAALAERYRAADVVLFPSEWNEPFGIVPLEAMACCTPVVATGTGGSGEYLADGENCLLVPPGNPRALAEAVTRLARDPHLRRMLVANGRSIATEITTDRLAERLWPIHANARRG